MNETKERSLKELIGKIVILYFSGRFGETHLKCKVVGLADKFLVVESYSKETFFAFDKINRIKVIEGEF